MAHFHLHDHPVSCRRCLPGTGVSEVSGHNRIPLGVLLWYKVLLFIAKSIFKKSGFFTHFSVKICCFIPVILFVLVFHETAFRFLFVPLALISLLASYKYILKKSHFSFISSNIPLILLVLLTILYYRWQIIPSFPRSPNNEKDISIMTYNMEK